jgi:MFS family permease
MLGRDLADVPLLFASRMLRLFAYGALSVVLVLYLKEAGLTGTEIGLLLTMTLIGDTLISLWLTTSADRFGRKRTLILGAGLMALAGLVFALARGFLPLLIAATIGVISPSGNEVGPFLAIEQAALSQTVSDDRRTGVFAWYQLAGSLATAAGALVCGLGLTVLEAQGFTTMAGYQVVLAIYAILGVVLAVLFLRLSSACEAGGLTSGQKRPKLLLGLHKSRGVVLKLSALFALDAFGGGFVLQSVMAYWFHIRFNADLATLGGIFFGANLLAGFSGLAAAALARRLGLINTMVFTHIPSNVLLILVPFMPTLPLAIAVLLMRFAISQMDVPTRQSYTVAVVSPDERSAAAGVTGVARTLGAALAPMFAGMFLGSAALAGGPFVVAGALKLAYDGLLYRLFSRVDVNNEIKKETEPVR